MNHLTQKVNKIFLFEHLNSDFLIQQNIDRTTVHHTVEFLGIWEGIYNPSFNYGEFAIIKSQAGLNNYKVSVKEWVEKTDAIGFKATAGRYGGTYAHKDIAFEFGMWISAEFKKENPDFDGNLRDNASLE